MEILNKNETQFKAMQFNKKNGVLNTNVVLKSKTLDGLEKLMDALGGYFKIYQTKDNSTTVLIQEKTVVADQSYFNDKKNKTSFDDIK